MARIQMNYTGFGTASMDIVVPQYGDSAASRNMTEEEYYGKKFKVLWLIHGGGGNCTDWLRYTELERFAAEKDLFVVCPSIENSFGVDMKKGDPWFTFLTGGLRELFFDMFPNASDQREDNFVAGLSMGGYAATHLALAAPELYSVSGSFSGPVKLMDEYYGGVIKEEALIDMIGTYEEAVQSDNNLVLLAEKTAKSGKPLPKIYLACGKFDHLFQMNNEYRDFLKELGYDVTWDEEEMNHEWGFWNHQIEKFIRILPAR